MPAFAYCHIRTPQVTSHRLNIFYMLMEKLHGFAEGKYEVNLSGADISQDYENKRTDAWERIEAMNITKRIVSTQKMMQASRQNSMAPSAIGRSNTTSTTASFGLGASPAAGTRGMAPPMRSPSSSSFMKKAPPPPSSSFAAPAAPPPYTPSTTGVSAAAGKRAPPPPPLKPKPKAEPPMQYVVALYDFAPQVCTFLPDYSHSLGAEQCHSPYQADGDLEFRVGDRIEVVERTESQEDWWTGRLNGRQGVFPGLLTLGTMTIRAISVADNDSWQGTMFKMLNTSFAFRLRRFSHSFNPFALSGFIDHTPHISWNSAARCHDTA